MDCSKPKHDCTVFDQKLVPDEDNRIIEDLSFWRPFSLRFERDAVERAFFRSVSNSWHVQDIVAHSLSILFVPAFFRALGTDIPRWHVFIIIFLSLFFAPLQLYTYCTNRQRYEKYRWLSTVFTRLASHFALSHFCIYFKAPSPTYFMLMLALLVKSPVVHLVIMSIHHRLEFRYHVPVQFTAFLLGATWISPFCRSCSTHPALLAKFEEMGYAIDSSISYTILNRLPDPKVYPCWMITTFVFTVTGMVIPTALIFITEAATRKTFLENRVSPSLHSSILKYTNEAINVATLASIAAVMGTWFLVSSLRDYVY